MINNWHMPKWFKSFFSNRMPKGDHVSLTPRSTYILPSKAGFFLLVIVLLMLIGAINYQNNLAFLLTFLLVGLGLVTSVFTVKNIQGIDFSLGHSQEAFVGETTQLDIHLKSQTNTPHMTVGIGFDSSNFDNGNFDNGNFDNGNFDNSNRDIMLTNVAEDAIATVALSLVAKQRGWQKIPRIKVTSQYPFGWLTAWGYLSFSRPILIYPQPIEPSDILSESGGKETDDGVMVAGNDDLYGLRSYQKGEPLNRVDWKAYARERGLHVRDFVSYQNNQLCFSWNDFVGIDDELKLSYLTYLVINAASHNFSYSLELPQQTFNYDSGEQHRKNCLTAIALYGLKQDEIL